MPVKGDLHAEQKSFVIFYCLVHVSFVSMACHRIDAPLQRADVHHDAHFIIRVII